MTVGVDRHALHVILWQQAVGAKKTVRVVQTRLAERLLVSRFTMNRILAEMVAAGRLEPVGRRSGPAARVYRVTNPAAWLSAQEPGDPADRPQS